MFFNYREYLVIVYKATRGGAVIDGEDDLKACIATASKHHDDYKRNPHFSGMAFLVVHKSDQIRVTKNIGKFKDRILFQAGSW